MLLYTVRFIQVGVRDGVLSVKSSLLLSSLLLVVAISAIFLLLLLTTSLAAGLKCSATSESGVGGAVVDLESPASDRAVNISSISK